MSWNAINPPIGGMNYIPNQWTTLTAGEMNTILPNDARNIPRIITNTPASNLRDALEEWLCNNKDTIDMTRLSQGITLDKVVIIKDMMDNLTTLNTTLLMMMNGHLDEAKKYIDEYPKLLLYHNFAIFTAAIAVCDPKFIEYCLKHKILLRNIEDYEDTMPDYVSKLIVCAKTKNIKRAK